MKTSQFNDEEADRVNRLLVPVKFAGPLTVLFEGNAQPEQIAVVQLDASNRPDVADLARVTRTEGIQRTGNPPFRYLLGNGDAGLLVELTITDPVECEFTFFLPWQQHEALFQLMIERGSFYLTAGDLDNTLKNSIGLSLSREELSNALRIWRGK